MSFLYAYVRPCVCIFIASLAFGSVFNLRGRKVLYTAIGGTLGCIVYLVTEGMHTNDVPRYFLAAVTVSIFSEIMARVTKTPATVYLSLTLIPLVPGGDMFYTMKYFVDGDMQGFLSKGVYAFSVAGAIALGVFAVSSITRLITVAISKTKSHNRRC